MTLALTPAQAELIGGALSFFFTVAIFSYLIGDNPLYRLALHTFIGVAVGYAGLIVIYQVIIPRLIQPLLNENMTIALLSTVPLILFLFLALKVNPRTAALGNVGIAYLIGVGAAVAIGGTLTGTLIPQIETTWLSLVPRDGIGLIGVINNAIILVATVTTLIYFQFWLRGQTATGTAGRTPITRTLAQIGQGFLMITLGVIYGGMILSGIAILGERVVVLIGWITSLLS